MKTPALFVGHGSPMNAIEENGFTRSLLEVRADLPSKPRAILTVSAHWETKGVCVQASKAPKTIHDFGGFPQALFDVQYPAPGAPELARKIEELLRDEGARATEDWGLDHGAWSVLRHLYPDADVPVLQLSLDLLRSPREHLRVAEKLKPLREEGVLILGTGNIVHNLRTIQWRGGSAAYDWAVRFDEAVKTALLKRDPLEIVKLMEEGSEDYRSSVPSVEHFLPLLYVSAVSDENEQPSFPFEGIEMGSISMRSVLYGN
ncbi:MAG TPA: 4,5-DOPA dioxygenase extradiol [Pseudobdellovibrionaceae bacterium]|nr:4,5-DOPA dioxygenase extradiol [Pseudobdellovibrionaceae bacterium]